MADEEKDNSKDESAAPEKANPTGDEAPQASEEASEGDAPAVDSPDDEKAPDDDAAPSKEDDVEIDEDLAAALGDAGSEQEEEVDVDKALAEADPNFEKEMGEISNEDFSGVVIDKDAASDEVDEDQKVPSPFKAFIANIPDEVKRRYMMAAGVLIVLIPLAILVYMGKILPSFELPYVVSMEEVTQDIYTYDTDGRMMPLFDEFRTNSHTVQLPKAIINLKSVGGEPAYGEFQFSLVLRDKDLSGAIDAKKSEIIDLVQRVLEQVTWRELQSPIGKEKVKKVVRHRINEYLQGNIVLGVYYRSVLTSK